MASKEAEKGGDHHKESSIESLSSSIRAYVLMSADDWRAIQETLYLAAIPGMRESIVDGMATPIGDLSEEPGW